LAFDATTHDGDCRWAMVKRVRRWLGLRHPPRIKGSPSASAARDVRFKTQAAKKNFSRVWWQEFAARRHDRNTRPTLTKRRQIVRTDAKSRLIICRLGPLLNVMLEVEGSPDAVMKKLHRHGTPRPWPWRDWLGPPRNKSVGSSQARQMTASIQSMMFLTCEEVRALTKRVQYSAQVKALRTMGIEHRARPDGSLVVLRSHIEQMFSGMSEKRKHQRAEPNWGALNATRT
jgi:hypothetical protein